MYQKKPHPLTKCILDSETNEIGRFQMKKYIGKTKVGGIDISYYPDLKEVQGPKELLKELKQLYELLFKDENLFLLNKI